MDAEQEIGRELKVSDLRPNTIVLVQPPGKPNLLFTFWVRSIDSRLVEFYAGALRWHVVNFIQPDGTLTDDQGRIVHVYEYLGEM